jgi:hypothetical protein
VTAADLSATVDWGDGSTSGGTVTGDGPFHVQAGHTYRQAGEYLATVTVHEADGGIAWLRVRVYVNEQPITAAAPSGPQVTKPGFKGTVATVTDPNPFATASDFSAVVSWGDGSTSSAAIAGSGPFVVTGAHKYALPGRYKVIVTVHDVGGSTATSSFNLIV